MPKKLTQDAIRKLLSERGLRVTASRLEVVSMLAEAKRPLSCVDLIEMNADVAWDSSTTYRTLKKLTKEGIAEVVSRIGGIDRYALVRPGSRPHSHAHFVCNDCGAISCLPELAEMTLQFTGRWAKSVNAAEVQLRGECPECIDE